MMGIMLYIGPDGVLSGASGIGTSPFNIPESLSNEFHPIGDPP